MKKRLLILTISLLFFSIFSNNIKALDNDTVIINGNTINNYEGQSFHHFLNGRYKSYEYVDYKMDVRWFFNDLTEYNNELAKLTLMLSVNTFVNSDMDVYDPNNKPDLSTIEKQREYMKSYMANLGFTNIIDYCLDSDYKDHDISEVFIGTMNVTYKGENKNIIGVFIRGTDGSYAEWTSNLDIGDLSKFGKPGYEDWKDEDNFKGYDVPCNRIYRKLKEYVTSNGLDGQNNLYWATGYSRSGPIANLLGAKLINEGKKVVAYTFASPAATTKSTEEVTADKYKTLFNINNGDDFVPTFPSAAWGSDDAGYKLYGNNQTIYASDLRSDGFLKKNGNEQVEYLVPTETAQNIITAVNNLFLGLDARVAAYEVKDKPLFIFPTESIYNSFVNSLSGEFKEEFSKLKRTEGSIAVGVYGSIIDYAKGLSWVMSGPESEEQTRYLTFFKMGLYMSSDSAYANLKNFHNRLIAYANYAPSCHVPTTYYEILRSLDSGYKSYPHVKNVSETKYTYNGEKITLTKPEIIGKTGVIEGDVETKIYSDIKLTQEINEIRNVGDYYVVYNFLGSDEYAPISSIPIKIQVVEPSNWNFKEQVNIADDAPYIDFKENVSITKYINITDPSYKNVVLELNENLEKDTNRINKIKNSYIGYNVADILDITLNLKYEKDGNQSKSITNLNNDIELVVDMSYLDEVIEGSTREFKVVSLHGNYISVLPYSYDSSTQELTFKTNRFSTFGILYKDVNYNPNSCENVYGPTWHWNNKKKICEDAGSVKTNVKINNKEN